MIDAQALSLSLAGQPILQNISFKVADGQTLGVVGPNGSGKSSLLRLLFRALRPDSGRITVDGDDLHRLSRRAIARRLAVLPQQRPADNGQTVYDLVSLGRLPHQGWLAKFNADDHHWISDTLSRVGLIHKANQPMARLSGGEIQRALIARALCQQASHLLLDEPTNHLDLRYQHDILALTRTLGLTTVIVLHDLNLAARYCDRLLLLNEGKAVALGRPSSILTAEQLEPVYGVRTTRLDRSAGYPHLIFAEPETPNPNTDLTGETHDHHARAERA